MQGNYETARRWSDVYAAQDERRRKEVAERARKEAAERAAAPTVADPEIVRSVGALHCGAVLYLYTDGTIRLGNGNEIKTALR